MERKGKVYTVRMVVICCFLLPMLSAPLTLVPPLCPPSGWNTVEREGISISHPARFILVGSGNPEEGELRPQLLDRFGMHAQVRAKGREVQEGGRKGVRI